MRRFHTVLFLPLGGKDDDVAATRVGALAARNVARLTVLGVVEEPSPLQQALHRSAHLEALTDSVRQEVQTRIDRCAAAAVDVAAERLVVTGDTALATIGQVLTAGHDLVVVTSEHEHDPVVRRLLRKCPVPVWVMRPLADGPRRVLAAVNPEAEEQALNATILQLASSLVEQPGDELHLVHAWQLYGESTMRFSGYLHEDPETIDALLAQAHDRHEQALSDLLAASGLQDRPWRIHLQKGLTEEVIDSVVDRHRITQVVMGTLARTGVRGLLIGNTAERVLDRITCSVITLKPEGFVSPVEVDRG